MNIMCWCATAGGLLACGVPNRYCCGAMSSAIRFAVMWLAACCQVLVVGVMPTATLVMAADPLGGIPICHAVDQGDSGQRIPLPERRQHDCAICSQMHASPLALLSPAPSLPTWQMIGMLRLDAAEPRAPPSRASPAAQPRGPPFLT